MREEALRFGRTKSLIGVLTPPPEAEDGKDLPAILLLNAGLIHHVGPNRLYVNLARALAAMGFAVLRFDLSGIGDSKVREDHLPFAESAVNETQEAMDHLSEARGHQRFILMGICSGARISFRTACSDPRVVGAVLINLRQHMHGTDEELDAHLRNRTLMRHYRRIAFSSSFSAKNWVKAITGRVDYWSVLKEVISFPLRSLPGRKGKASSYANQIAADFRLLDERGVRVLHVYSEGDEGLDYLHVILGDKMKELSACGLLRIEIVKGANHTFTLLWSQEHLLETICRWAQIMMPD